MYYNLININYELYIINHVKLILNLKQTLTNKGFKQYNIGLFLDLLHIPLGLNECS